MDKIILTLVFITLIFSFIHAEDFGYNYLDTGESVITGGNYSINTNYSDTCGNANTLNGYSSSYFYPYSNPFNFYNSSTLDLSGYFLLDQSTPQTVSGGSPIFENGITIGTSYPFNIYESGYGDSIIDIVGAGGCYLCGDAYCSYYIDWCGGYTSLYVDYASYSDYATYADSAGNADYATSAGNADTVDNIHASTTATADYLYPLDSNGNMILSKDNGRVGVRDVTTNKSTYVYKNATESGIKDNTNKIWTTPYYLNNSPNKIGTLSSQNLSTTHSIFFWTYADSAPSGQYIMGDGSTDAIGFNSVTQIAYTTGTAVIKTHGGATGWNRWAFVRSGSTVTIYKNGVSLGSGSCGTNSFDFSYFLTFGGSLNFTNSIDELVIYSDAKNQAFVTADYNSGAGRYALATDTNVRNIYHMDEGTGASLSDAKGSATITMNSAPNWVSSDKSLNTTEEVINIFRFIKDGVGSLGVLIFGESSGFITRLYNTEVVGNLNITGNVTIQSTPAITGNWNCTSFPNVTIKSGVITSWSC